MGRHLKDAIKLLKKTMRINDMSLLNKYKCLFLAIICVPIILILTLSFLLIINSINRQREVSAAEVFTFANHVVSDNLESVEMQTYSILTDNKINGFIFSNDIVNDTSHILYSQSIINYTMKVNKVLNSVYIYSLSNDYVIGTNAVNYMENFDTKRFIWFDYYKRTGKSDFIIPVNGINGKELCMVRGLKKGKKVCALIACNINADMLFSFKGDEDYVLYSTDSNSVLFSTDNAKINTKEIGTKSNYSKLTWSSIVISSPIFYSKLILITEIKDMVKTFYIKIIVFSLLVIILVLLMATKFSKYITNAFYSNIAKTISYLTDDSGSEYDNSQDELEWIKKSIDYLICTNMELEQQLSKSIIQLKNSQLAAMQMQCNPHFLFNALNLANMQTISLLGGNNAASEIIVLVSDLLYSSLHTRSYYVTLEDELSFVQKYIRIEEIKYKSNFDITYDADESLMHCKTVRLTMQPLIENAFRHGILKLQGSKKGYITVSIKEENENILIKISDNGVPDDAHIESINKDLNGDIYTIIDQHIGLKNVNSRIKILFGAKYGCSIYRENGFTVSQIIIPKEEF